jgi:hypothetical protein
MFLQHISHNTLKPVSCFHFFPSYWLSLQVGTLPLDVGVCATTLQKGQTLDELIEAILRSAENDLTGFTHQPILSKLKESPEGIRCVQFKGVKHEGVNLAEPREVAAAMKRRQAIFYHIPSGEYRLATRAHRTVLLERYDPVEPSVPSPL